MSNEQTEQMIKSQEKGEAYRAGRQGADEPTQEEQRGDQQDSGQRNPPAR